MFMYKNIILNIFFSKTTWPIKAKFNVAPPWEEETNDSINGLSHITKMAAMLIYKYK